HTRFSRDWSSDVCSSDVGPLQPRDDPQERRLPAAARAEEGGELAGRDADRHVVEGDEVAEALADVPDLDAHELLPPDWSGRTSVTTAMQAAATGVSRNAVA